MSSTMALSERALVELESIIERGQQTFVEVGQALMAIRDRRLYRQQGHATFEDYCQKRWGCTRRIGYNYIKAAMVTQNVLLTAQTPPTLTQAATLAPLSIEQQQEIAGVVDFSQTTVSQLKGIIADARQALAEKLDRPARPEPVI